MSNLRNQNIQKRNLRDLSISSSMYKIAQGDAMPWENLIRPHFGNNDTLKLVTDAGNTLDLSIFSSLYFLHERIVEIPETDILW